VSSQACRWLAGLETGVWAGLAMLGWFMLAAVWSQHSIWELPNRLGSLFYGRAASRGGFHAGTSAGLALHLFSSGVVGLLFGGLAREGRRRVRAGLLGLVMGLCWYYISYAWFWKRLLPLAGGPPASLLAPYLVFGLVLGVYPGRLRSAERHFLGDAGSREGAELPPRGPPATGGGDLAPPGSFG